MSYRYQITVSDQARAALESMLEWGIYGRSVPEIIKRLVDRQLVAMLSPKLKLQKGPDSEEDQP